MNPSKNYNKNPKWSSIKLVTPIPSSRHPGEMVSYLPDRSKSEKVRDIKRLKDAGVEENIVGYCNRCNLPRTYTRKPQSTIHYNCPGKCCRMLHQWDMCEYCFVDEYGPKPVYDDQTRRDEVAKFHQVFSKLPDDLKKNIGEYVPLIFQFVGSLTRLVFFDRKLATLDQYVLSRPKSTWVSIASVITGKYKLPKSVNKSSSRQVVCSGVKELYRAQYITYKKSLIQERDFWTHNPWCIPHRYYNNSTIQELETIKTLI